MTGAGWRIGCVVRRHAAILSLRARMPSKGRPVRPACRDHADRARP
jgi:hypothetical protein